MFKQYPLCIKIIASILVVTFLAQDVVWANPDACRDSAASSSLQIQPFSRTAPTDPVKLLEARFVQVMFQYHDLSEMREMFEELKSRKITVPITEDSGVKLYLDFGSGRNESDEWTIPCRAVDRYGRVSGHDVRMDRDGGITVLEAGKRPGKDVAASEEERLPDRSRTIEEPVFTRDPYTARKPVVSGTPVPQEKPGRFLKNKAFPWEYLTSLLPKNKTHVAILAIAAIILVISGFPQEAILATPAVFGGMRSFSGNFFEPIADPRTRQFFENAIKSGAITTPIEKFNGSGMTCRERPVEFCEMPLSSSYGLPSNAVFAVDSKDPMGRGIVKIVFAPDAAQTAKDMTAPELIRALYDDIVQIDGYGEVREERDPEERVPASTRRRPASPPAPESPKTPRVEEPKIEEPAAEEPAAGEPETKEPLESAYNFEEIIREGLAELTGDDEKAEYVAAICDEVAAGKPNAKAALEALKEDIEPLMPVFEGAYEGADEGAFKGYHAALEVLAALGFKSAEDRIKHIAEGPAATGGIRGFFRKATPEITPAQKLARESLKRLQELRSGSASSRGNGHLPLLILIGVIGLAYSPEISACLHSLRDYFAPFSLAELYAALPGAGALPFLYYGGLRKVGGTRAAKEIPYYPFSVLNRLIGRAKIFRANVSGTALQGLMVTPMLERPAFSGNKKTAQAMSANLREAMKTLAEELAPGEETPGPLELNPDLSGFAGFRILEREGPEVYKSGTPAVRPAASAMLTADGTFEINIMGQILDERGLSDEAKAELREVRLLVLRNALDHLTPETSEENILFRDIMYVSMLPDKRWDRLVKGLEGLKSRYKEGEHPYIRLLMEGRQKVRSAVFDKGRDLSGIDFKDLGKGAHAELTRLARENDGFREIGTVAIGNLATDMHKDPERNESNRRLYQFHARSSEGGLLYLGALNYSGYKDRIAINLHNVKTGTLYKVTPAYNGIIKKWVLEMREVRKKGRMPVAAVPECYALIDGSTTKGVRYWHPGFLVADHIKAKLRGRKKLPPVPDRIITRKSSDTRIYLGAYDHTGTNYTVVLEIRKKGFENVRAVRVELNSADPEYGLTAKVYAVDEMTAGDLSPVPWGCFYYDFKKKDFVSFDKGGTEIPSIERTVTLAAMFGVKTYTGIYAKPRAFVMRSRENGIITLKRPLSSVLAEAGFDVEQPNDMLSIAGGFKPNALYRLEVHFDRQYGWIIETYGLDESLNTISAVPVNIHRLVAKISDKVVAGPLINKRQIIDTIGKAALRGLIDYADIADLKKLGFTIATEEFDPGRQSIIDIFADKKVALMPSISKVTTEGGFIHICTVKEADGHERFVKLCTDLPMGSRVRIEPVYSNKRGGWVLFGFEADRITGRIIAGGPLNVWRVDRRGRAVYEVLLDPREKRRLLSKIAGGEHSYCPDLLELLPKAGLAGSGIQIADKARKDFEKARGPLKDRAISYLTSVFPAAVRSGTREALAGAASEWRQIQEGAGLPHKDRMKMPLAVIGKCVEMAIRQSEEKLNAGSLTPEELAALFEMPEADEEQAKYIKAILDDEFPVDERASHPQGDAAETNRQEELSREILGITEKYMRHVDSGNGLESPEELTEMVKMALDNWLEAIEDAGAAKTFLENVIDLLKKGRNARKRYSALLEIVDDGYYDKVLGMWKQVQEKGDDVKASSGKPVVKKDTREDTEERDLLGNDAEEEGPADVSIPVGGEPIDEEDLTKDPDELYREIDESIKGEKVGASRFDDYEELLGAGIAGLGLGALGLNAGASLSLPEAALAVAFIIGIWCLANYVLKRAFLSEEERDQVERRSIREYFLEWIGGLKEMGGRRGQAPYLVYNAAAFLVAILASLIFPILTNAAIPFAMGDIMPGEIEKTAKAPVANRKTAPDEFTVPRKGVGSKTMWNFVYTGFGAYMNYLEKCGIKDLEGVTFKKCGRELAIYAQVGRGKSRESVEMHRIRLNSESLPDAIDPENNRHIMTLLSILKKQGAPLVVYIAKENYFSVNFVKWWLNSFAKHFNVSAEDLIVFKYLGDKEPHKRIEVRVKDKGFAPTGWLLTTIDIDEEGVPVGLTEEEAGKPKNEMVFDVLEHQMRLGKIPERESVSIRKEAVNNETRLIVDGVDYGGIRQYIRYLSRAGIKNIKGIEIAKESKDKVDLYAIIEEGGRIVERKKTHSILLDENGLPGHCEHLTDRSMVSILAVLELQNNPIRVAMDSDRYFTINGLYYVNLDNYLAFKGYTRDRAEVFKICGKEEKKHAVEARTKPDDDGLSEVIFRIELDNENWPVGLDRNVRHAEIVIVLNKQGYITKEEHDRYKKWLVSLRQIKVLEKQPRMSDREDLIGRARLEARDNVLISPSTAAEIWNALGLGGFGELERKGLWPIYDLLHDPAREAGLGGPFFNGSVPKYTEEQARAELASRLARKLSNTRKNLMRPLSEGGDPGLRSAAKRYNIPLPSGKARKQSEPQVSFLRRDIIKYHSALPEREARELWHRMRRGDARAKVRLANAVPVIVLETIEDLYPRENPANPTEFIQEMIAAGTLAVMEVMDDTRNDWNPQECGLYEFLREKIETAAEEASRLRRAGSPYIRPGLDISLQNRVRTGRNDTARERSETVTTDKGIWQPETAARAKDAVSPASLEELERLVDEQSVEAIGKLALVGEDKDRLSRELEIFFKHKNFSETLKKLLGIQDFCIYMVGSMGMLGRALKGYSDVNLVLAADTDPGTLSRALMVLHDIIGGHLTHDRYTGLPVLFLGKNKQYYRDIAEGNGFISLLTKHEIGGPLKGIATIETLPLNEEYLREKLAERETYDEGSYEYEDDWDDDYDSRASYEEDEERKASAVTTRSFQRLAFHTTKNVHGYVNARLVLESRPGADDSFKRRLQRLIEEDLKEGYQDYLYDLLRKILREGREKLMALKERLDRRLLSESEAGFGLLEVWIAVAIGSAGLLIAPSVVIWGASIFAMWYLADLLFKRIFLSEEERDQVERRSIRKYSLEWIGGLKEMGGQRGYLNVPSIALACAAAAWLVSFILPGAAGAIPFVFVGSIGNASRGSSGNRWERTWHKWLPRPDGLSPEELTKEAGIDSLVEEVVTAGGLGQWLEQHNKGKPIADQLTMETLKNFIFTNRRHKIEERIKKATAEGRDQDSSGRSMNKPESLTDMIRNWMKEFVEAAGEKGIDERETDLCDNLRAIKDDWLISVGEEDLDEAIRVIEEGLRSLKGIVKKKSGICVRIAEVLEDEFLGELLLRRDIGRGGTVLHKGGGKGRGKNKGFSMTLALPVLFTLVIAGLAAGLACGPEINAFFESLLNYFASIGSSGALPHGKSGIFAGLAFSISAVVISLYTPPVTADTDTGPTPAPSERKSETVIDDLQTASDFLTASTVTELTGEGLRNSPIGSEKAGLLLVLGNDYIEETIDCIMAALRNGLADTVLISGGRKEGTRFSNNLKRSRYAPLFEEEEFGSIKEAEALERILLDQGAAARILTETASQDTRQNIKNSIEILRREGIAPGSVVVLSAMLRSRLTADKLFDENVKIANHTVHRFDIRRMFSRGAKRPEMALWVFSELRKLRIYAERGHVSPMDIPVRVRDAAGRLAKEFPDEFAGVHGADPGLVLPPNGVVPRTGQSSGATAEGAAGKRDDTVTKLIYGRPHELRKDAVANIRRARVEDVPRIKELCKLIFPSYKGNNLYYENSIKNTMSRDALWVYEEGGRVDGYLYVVCDSDGSNVVITHVAVDEAAQDKGIGSALVAQALEYAEENKIRTCDMEANHDGSVRLAVHFGLERHGRNGYYADFSDYMKLKEKVAQEIDRAIKVHGLGELFDRGRIDKGRLVRETVFLYSKAHLTEEEMRLEIDAAFNGMPSEELIRILANRSFDAKQAKVVEEADRVLSSFFTMAKGRHGITSPFGYVPFKESLTFVPEEVMQRYYSVKTAMEIGGLYSIVVNEKLEGLKQLAILIHEGMHLNVAGFNYKNVGEGRGARLDEEVAWYFTREALREAGYSDEAITAAFDTIGKWVNKYVSRVDGIVRHMGGQEELLRAFCDGEIRDLPIIPASLTREIMHGNRAVTYKGRRMPFATARKKILRSAGKTTPEDSVYILIERQKDGDPVISRFIAGRAKDGRKALEERFKELAGEIESLEGYKRLRDLSDANRTCQDIIAMILGMALKKKVVIGFDRGLGNFQSSKAFAIFEVIQELKAPGSPLAPWLKNVEVVVREPRRLARELESYADSGAEVFMFARASEQSFFTELEKKVHAGYIDETSGFSADAFYPLPYVVAITLAEAQGSRIVNNLIANPRMLSLINIRKISATLSDKEKVRLIAELSVEAKPLSSQRDLTKEYVAWKRYMRVGGYA